MIFTKMLFGKIIAVSLVPLLVCVFYQPPIALAARTGISFTSNCLNKKSQQFEVHVGVTRNCTLTFTIAGPDKAGRVVKIGRTERPDTIHWEKTSVKSDKSGKGTFKHAFSELIKDDGECYEGGPVEYIIQVAPSSKSGEGGGLFDVVFFGNDDNC